MNEAGERFTKSSKRVAKLRGVVEKWRLCGLRLSMPLMRSTQQPHAKHDALNRWGMLCGDGLGRRNRYARQPKEV